MNILAFYLPQFHAIKENDDWWGKNYTEWDSIKRGEMLIDNQYQPRIPLGKNYYNLLDIDVMKWQTKIAKSYGIYGFCVYHYWFNGKLLLEKPMENYLEHKEIDFPYCFCWANEDWSNIWSGDLNNIKVLISNNYNNEDDWISHFNYFLPFFKDSRYIKVHNKPLLVIYNPLLISTVDKIIDCWNKLAKQNGFDGMVFCYQVGTTMVSNDVRKSYFNYGIEYYPGLVFHRKRSAIDIKWQEFKHGIADFLRRKISIKLFDRKIKQADNPKCLRVENYDEVWKSILSYIPDNDNILPGAFVDWDNTPRKKYLGMFMKGATPEKFEKYMSEQIKRARNIYHKQLMFIFAWNEWSEGGYLEPDEKYGYLYLESLKKSLMINNEFPDWDNEFKIND